MERVKIAIQGQVQGVGFRPCVYQIARTLGLTGWIQNDASGVLIEVQGVLAPTFCAELLANLPPLARVTLVESYSIPIQSDEGEFTIKSSQPGKINTIISPDTNTCSTCLKELVDPESRYFDYPFLNCTQCGPRYSITRHLPYDRCQTSMDSFVLCASCYQEYCDPDNRRYHAQPTACAQCGPQLSASIEQVKQDITQGAIIALKGLGGYQLICDARNEEAVLKLRLRKNREAKPFALMLANSHAAAEVVFLSEQAQKVLESPARPIVVLKRKGTQLPAAIAPGLNHLGVMLPCTPIHHLLFKNTDLILVVTSANMGGEPLIIEDVDAQQKLETIADRIVSYNREIVTRVDDSVVRMIDDAPIFIRRARGYVPNPIRLPRAIPATLALGGHLKNTFCITRGDEAFVSQHIGSLNNKATIDFFHETLNHLLHFLDVTPERIAHDWHPDFYTTRLAQEYDIPAFPVQHHHAHLASVVAEYGIEQPVLGLVLDGYGYGHAGEAWGGELLLLDGAAVTRLGHFLPLAQPGGELAAKEPWRMAASVLHHLGRGDEIGTRFSNHAQAQGIHPILIKGINSPRTSSCGRLFDAASALAGVEYLSQYEGHAAMRLERYVTEPEIMPDGWQINQGVFNLLPTLEYIAGFNDRKHAANLFHGTLIAGLSEWIIKACRDTQIDVIVLSGGCFLNQILAEGLIKTLRDAGIKALLPRILPPNDGGISLGQAWITGISLCV